MACTIVGFCKAEVKDQVKKPSPYSDVTALAKVDLHLYCFTWYNFVKIDKIQIQLDSNLLCTFCPSSPNFTWVLGNLLEALDILRNTHKIEGAKWLSGRVFDSRPRSRRFKPHQRH